MPTIAIIHGVRIVIYLKDHLPPHLHAIFAEHEAQISIVTGDVLNGSLPAAKSKAVQALAGCKPRPGRLYLARDQRGPLQRRSDHMNYKIKHIEAVCCPVLQVTFDDGLSGAYDLGGWIGQSAQSKRLDDPDYFKTVSVASGGRSFGWRLDDEGHEIDFCSGEVRITVEIAMAEHLAANYAASRSAAE